MSGLRYWRVAVKTGAMTIIIALVSLSFIGLLAYRDWKKMVTADSIVYWSALAFRLLAGLALGIVYK